MAARMASTDSPVVTRISCTSRPARATRLKPPGTGRRVIHSSRSCPGGGGNRGGEVSNGGIPNLRPYEPA